MNTFLSCPELVADLSEIGVRSGDAVMVHAAMSTVGNLINGPDTLIDALAKTVGPKGCIVAYTDWDARYEELVDGTGRVPIAWRNRIAGFDPMRSRAVRDHGVFAEFLRTTPGALRSANPGASIAAIGARAEWLVADHPLDYGYGPASPLAKLVEAGGKVLMVGAPFDTMTLIHHAEHLADIPNKRVKRWEVPFAGPDGTFWRMSEEFDTSDSVAPQLDGVDYFTAIVTSYLGAGCGRQGRIGAAESLLVDAKGMLEHAVAWLERNGR